MTTIDHIRGIWSISGAFWSLFCFYTSIRIMQFIVRRYEQETDLLKTIYFKEHATFTRYLPGYLSSGLYIAHLISFIWLWNYCRKKRPYRDIAKADQVLRHFSIKEIRKIKIYVISGIILIFHGLVYLIFHIIRPEVFS
jgi:hypothetical protein